MRRLIYTTNTIEGFNRQFRTENKAKSVFTTVDSLLKMLYPAIMDIAKVWIGRGQFWNVIYTQLSEYLMTGYKKKSVLKVKS